MHKISVAMFAVALAAIPLTNAKAYTYSSEEGDWVIAGKSHGKMLFMCSMTRLYDDSKFFSFVTEVQVKSFKMRTTIGVHTKLGDGDGDIKGTLTFQSGKTFTFIGSVKRGIAMLDVPADKGMEIKLALDIEKPVKVTLTRPGSPTETTDIDLADARGAVYEKQVCMTELFDRAGILP